MLFFHLSKQMSAQILLLSLNTKQKPIDVDILPGL